MNVIFNLLKHPFKIVVIGIVAAILGLAVVPLLPVDLNPIAKQHQLSVSYTLTNASPAVVENEVTSILENVFSKFRVHEAFNAISYCLWFS